MELRGLVVTTTGIGFRGPRLLKIDLRQSLLPPGQNVLTFDEERLAAILDLKVRLAVFDDVANVAHAGHLTEVTFEVVLGYTATNGCCQSKCPGDDVEDLARRESDRIETSLASGQVLIPSPDRHPLEMQLGLPASQILDIISGAFRLAAAVRGGVAEHHLERHLRHVPGVSNVRHIVEDGKPDFEVKYRRKPFLIECKNVLARRQQGLAKVDFQKTRASKADPCSRYYKPTQFHVLAACLYPVTQKWEFRFASTGALAPHPRCSGRLSSNVIVQQTWPTDLTTVLDGF